MKEKRKSTTRTEEVVRHIVQGCRCWCSDVGARMLVLRCPAQPKLYILTSMLARPEGGKMALCLGSSGLVSRLVDQSVGRSVLPFLIGSRAAKDLSTISRLSKRQSASVPSVWFMPQCPQFGLCLSALILVCASVPSFWSVPQCPQCPQFGLCLSALSLVCASVPSVWSMAQCLSARVRLSLPQLPSISPPSTCTDGSMGERVIGHVRGGALRWWKRSRKSRKEQKEQEEEKEAEKKEKKQGVAASRTLRCGRVALGLRLCRPRSQVGALGAGGSMVEKVSISDSRRRGSEVEEQQRAGLHSVSVPPSGEATPGRQSSESQ